MKKIVKIVLIVIILIIILAAGFVGYLFLKRESDISKLPDYYQNLAKECESKDGYACCMVSVRMMAGGNHKLEPETGCQTGYQLNMLKCIGTFRWCEPIEPGGEFACETDSDCDFHYTKWGKDNPCFPCWYVSDEVICMNKEEVEKEMDRIIEEEFGGSDRVPLCERCFEDDYDSYSCKCIDNKCFKLSDYYRDLTEACEEKPGFECCMSGLRDMIKNNYLLADENENCPEGFRPEMQLCEDSLIWCEPVK